MQAFTFFVSMGARYVQVVRYYGRSFLRDGYFEMPVEPGHHTLQVSKGRYWSRVKAFDAAEDEFVAFRCNRRRHPLILAATLFDPSLAISLTRE